MGWTVRPTTTLPLVLIKRLHPLHNVLPYITLHTAPMSFEACPYPCTLEPLTSDTVEHPVLHLLPLHMSIRTQSILPNNVHDTDYPQATKELITLLLLRQRNSKHRLNHNSFSSFQSIHILHPHCPFLTAVHQYTSYTSTVQLPLYNQRCTSFL